MMISLARISRKGPRYLAYMWGIHYFYNLVIAFAILMPALLLNTACNSEIINNENTDGKGYALPVTVNVTRQGDDPSTKATYNEETKKLSFSTGDKLFVNGKNGAGIGSGRGIENNYWKSNCGNITISNTVTKVTATKGSDAANSIGKGDSTFSTCGIVTIGDVEGAISTSPYTYPAS